MSESQSPSVAEASPKRRHYPEDFQRDAVRLVSDEKYTFRACMHGTKSLPHRLSRAVSWLRRVNCKPK